MIFANILLRYIRNLRALKKYVDKILTVVCSRIPFPAKSTFIIYYYSPVGAVPCSKPSSGCNELL
jgi:hypothetical protein